MKVLEEKLESGKSRKQVLQAGKRKFVRIASVKGVDWRRYKTNHQVKQVEFNTLEEEYLKNFSPDFIPQSFMKDAPKVNFKGIGRVIEDDKERRRLERKIASMCDNGNGSKLAAVRYLKEQTGWGLKESKDFVFNFLERQKAFSKW